MEKAIIALSLFCNAPNLKNHNPGIMEFEHDLLDVGAPRAIA